MRRTSLWILVLALVAGACSSDDGRPVDPSRLGIQIVSGDRQVAPVAAASGASQVRVPAGVSAQTLPDNLLPEPLVARIVVDGEPLKSVGSGVTGLSLATLPSDVVVTYRVIQPMGFGNRHCGDSFISSATPDAQGLVTTYWERGTLAGEECRMEVRLVVDGEPRVDTVFVAEFEPGPVAHVSAHDGDHQGFYSTDIGETFDLRPIVSYGFDHYSNSVSAEAIRALPDSLVRWEWRDRSAPQDSSRFIYGTGWTVTVPDAPALGYGLSSQMYVVNNKNTLCWQFEVGFRFWVNDADVSSAPYYRFVPEPPGFTYPELLCSQIPPE